MPDRKNSDRQALGRSSPPLCRKLCRKHGTTMDERPAGYVMNSTKLTTKGEGIRPTFRSMSTTSSLRPGGTPGPTFCIPFMRTICGFASTGYTIVSPPPLCRKLCRELCRKHGTTMDHRRAGCVMNSTKLTTKGEGGRRALPSASGFIRACPVPRGGFNRRCGDGLPLRG
jgi:hypothetical protein